jgi:hypothetical protein
VARREESPKEPLARVCTLGKQILHTEPAALPQQIDEAGHEVVGPEFAHCMRALLRETR